ncbi:MAG: glycosyltransferase [Candidatus Latescibacterota bacterium]|nr:MAG: glycosyltransferase [Candidatus Latescibacterota bacterium]
MKNLLMIIPFFPPNAGGGVYRPLGFVKYLERCGWRPIVVTPQSESFWIMDETLLRDVPSNCEVRRTRTLSGQYMLSRFRGKRQIKGSRQVRSSRGFGFLRKLGATLLVPDTYIGWYPFAVREGRKVLEKRRIDAIYSTSPPETSHLVAHKLHEISGVPWVADFRDPWMNLHLLPRPTPFHDRLHESLERRVCSKAATIVTNRWHLELLEKRYPQLKRVTLIPNGYDPADVEAVMDLEPSSEVFQIVHAGMLTQKRSAIPFLKALRIFLDRTPDASKRCRVIFLGPRESDNEREVTNLGLDGVVSFRDTVKHHEAVKIERSSQLLLLIKHKNPVYDGIVPGKLYEYIGVRRPILALVPEGEAGDIVKRLNRGEIAPLDDTQGIAERIGMMYEKHRERKLDQEYDLNPVAEYRRDVLTGELAAYLDSMSDGGD